MVNTQDASEQPETEAQKPEGDVAALTIKSA